MRAHRGSARPLLRPVCAGCLLGGRIGSQGAGPAHADAESTMSVLAATGTIHRSLRRPASPAAGPLSTAGRICPLAVAIGLPMTVSVSRNVTPQRGERAEDRSEEHTS